MITRDGILSPKSKRRLSQVFKYTILISLLIFSITPFVWILFSALKSEKELWQNPLGLPVNPHWENFVEAWRIGRFGEYIANSFVITLPTVVAVCILSSLAGYAFAKRRFIGRDMMSYIFLMGLMLPFQAIMIPLYFLMQRLHLLYTYWAAILPMIALGLPLGIFIMRAFFRSLPDELLDAARIDGCSHFGAFWRVMLPLARPAFTSVATFQFMTSWNNFIIPLIYIQREELRPMTVGLMFFQSRFDMAPTLICAGSIITILPIAIFYVIFQQQFIEGLTAGAIRG